MARVAQGWRLDKNGSNWRVRFTHDGRRYAVSTGTGDKGAARDKAKKIYAETVAGARRVAAEKQLGYPLDDAFAKWVVHVRASRDTTTAKEYERAGSKWCEVWQTVQQIQTKQLRDHTDYWLARTTRESTRKYRTYLADFLRFCKEQEIISVVPEMPDLEKGTTGKRALPENPPIIITADQANEVIDELPDWSARDSRLGCGRFHVRNYYRVLWETAWRPSTVDKIAAPRHIAKDSARITVTPDIVKDRNRSRGRAHKVAFVDIPAAAMTALQASIADSSGERGEIFGRHRAHRAAVLLETARRVLRLELTDYDFKHSRMTDLCSRPGADYVAISYLAGVKLDTIIEHYVHPGEKAARRYVATL
jgi:hypothetical protein